MRFLVEFAGFSRRQKAIRIYHSLPVIQPGRAFGQLPKQPREGKAKNGSKFVLTRVTNQEL